jgi:hypothetical protein
MYFKFGEFKSGSDSDSIESVDPDQDRSKKALLEYRTDPKRSGERGNFCRVVFCLEGLDVLKNVNAEK